MYVSPKQPLTVVKVTNININKQKVRAVDIGNPEEIVESELVEAIAVLIAEQSRRSLARADVPAVIEHGFNVGFSNKGEANDPWLTDGILVAPGVKTDRSANAHTCTFVRVGQQWVWEAHDRVEDVIRNSVQAKAQMRSITLVAAPEGTSVDKITSRARNGKHELMSVRSFVVSAGQLELVSARAIRSSGHR